MIPGVNIINRKASVAGIKGAGGAGGALSPSLRKFLGSKEHLDWLKIHLNTTEISTVQDHKHTKN